LFGRGERNHRFEVDMRKEGNVFHYTGYLVIECIESDHLAERGFVSEQLSRRSFSQDDRVRIFQRGFGIAFQDWKCEYTEQQRFREQALDGNYVVAHLRILRKVVAYNSDIFNAGGLLPDKSSRLY